MAEVGQDDMMFCAASSNAEFTGSRCVGLSRGESTPGSSQAAGVGLWAVSMNPTGRISISVWSARLSIRGRTR